MLRKPGQTGFTPFNTLNRQSLSRDETVSKRQKNNFEGDSTPVKSPYFEHDRIKTDVDSDCEIQSPSSAGYKPSTQLRSSTKGCLPHLHQVHVGFTTYGSKQRRLRDKQKKRPQTTLTGEKEYLSLDSPMKHEAKANASAAAIAADSPDALALGDPPPANIVSDLDPDPRGRKRARPGQSIMIKGPSVKRSRPPHQKEEIHGSDSEDELLMSQPATRSDAFGKRKTNFSGVQHLRRGDIPPTNFTRRGSQSANEPSTEPLLLTRACTPRDFYDAHSSDGLVIQLQPDASFPKRLVATDKHGESMLLEWLNIDLAKVLACRHDSKHSCHVSLTRSQSDRTPAKLFLEFATEQEATALINLLPKTVKQTNVEAKKLAAEMEHQLNDIRTYREARKHQPENTLSSFEVKSEQIPDRCYTAASQTGLHGAQDAHQRPGLAEETSSQTLPESPGISRNRSPPISATPYQSFGREPRRTKRSLQRPLSRDPSPFSQGWTTSNPEWEGKWTKSLVFPATGKNRAIVDKDDIPRLDESQFLNDNLINFYIRYLQSKMEESRPELLRRVYFFNTFFFEKLRSTKGRINYDGIKAWTAKIDVFSYDYIVVPVNENAHWYLAIICNTPNTVHRETDTKPPASQSQDDSVQIVAAPTTPRKLPGRIVQDEASKSETRESMDLSEDAPPALATPSSSTPVVSRRLYLGYRPKQKYEPGQPKIITLDSLGSPHSPTCTALREYLSREADTRKGVKLSVPPTGMTARGIPEQDNYCDCGVFILGYMEEFLKDPDTAAGKLLRKEELDWDIQAPQLRNKLRSIIFELQEEQSKTLAEKVEQKRLVLERRKQAMTSKLQAGPGPEKLTRNTQMRAAEQTMPDEGAFPHLSVEFGSNLVSPLGASPVSNPEAVEANPVLVPSPSLFPSEHQPKSGSRLTSDDKNSKETSLSFTQLLPDSPPERSKTTNPDGHDLQSPREPRRVRSTPSSPNQLRKRGSVSVTSPLLAKLPAAIESIEFDDPQPGKGTQYDGIEVPIDLTR